MSLDWFPWYPHDFRRDTYHLTLEEDGAYRRLIDEYMITRKPLPNDSGALARILGIPTTDWHRIAPNVMRFFRARNSVLIHKRCESELRAQNARHNRFSERGKKAAFAKYSKINKLPASSMLVPATLQYKERKPSENPAARASNGTVVENHQSAGLLATAPCDGALARQPIAEKPPSSLTKAELAEIYAKKRLNGDGRKLGNNGL